MTTPPPLARPRPAGPRVSVLVWVAAHRWHILLFPILALTAVTFLHELAHAVMVWLQGGEVHELSFLPTAHELGHTSYRLGPGGDEALVAFGPTLLWLGVSAVSALWALLAPPTWRPLGRALFVWGYLVPLADVTWHAGPWLLGGTNDLRHALGRPDDLWALLVVLGAAAAFAVAWAMQRRLYREDALDPARFTALAALAATGALVAVLAF